MDTPSTEDPVPEAGDMDLVRRLQAGDERAFDTFATDYFPALHRFASSRLQSHRDLVADIVQATLCKAIAKLDTYRGEAQLMTWLCTICRNEIAMYFRRQSSRPEEVELLEEVRAHDTAGPATSTPMPTPERRLQRKERGRLVHVALDQLAPRHAQVLEWKYLEEMPVKQIAWRLRISQKAAESLLTRARVAFERRFSALTAAPTSTLPSPKASESVLQDD